MLSIGEWAGHPQGRAVAPEPLVYLAATQPAGAPNWALDPARPLDGLRILDLTRVLAGPVATRCMAGFGAHVLRIDPPDWDEPALVPDVTLGKKCARLDLRVTADVFDHLLSRADVLVHGYRPGALDKLGYPASFRQSLSPGLIDVSLDAYGWRGPWAGRRGFDSLVQMSTGIAHTAWSRRRPTSRSRSFGPGAGPCHRLSHGRRHPGRNTEVAENAWLASPAFACPHRATRDRAYPRRTRRCAAPRRARRSLAGYRRLRPGAERSASFRRSASRAFRCVGTVQRARLDHTLPSGSDPSSKREMSDAMQGI